MKIKGIMPSGGNDLKAKLQRQKTGQWSLERAEGKSDYREEA